MPRIFDNIDQQLLPALQLAMSNSHRGDFCVGYLNLRGWRQLDQQIESWSGQDGSCCRLLVGMQRLPEQELHEAYSLIDGDPDLDNQTAIRLRKRLAQEFRSQLTIGAPTDADEAGLRRLAHQIREGKVVVKLFLRHTLHAKLYLCHRTDPINPAIAFLGSSNLTFAGLAKQGELNVDVMDHDSCRKVSKWFEDRWTDKWCIDISKEIVDIIQQSWAREDAIPPHHIYVKMAYHLSQEAREGIVQHRIPKDFGNKLFDFQTAAVKIAAHHVHKRGGVLLGDVVGLGKTLIATALARVLSDDLLLETLILCPLNLVPMWEDYCHKYRLPSARVLSYSRVIGQLPDLRRYRLVILDESHNLRNREGKIYKAVADYVNKNECKCVLLSATPFNKDYLDLASQFRLFVPPDKDLGIGPQQLLTEIGELEFIRKHQCGVRTLAAFEKSPYISRNTIIPFLLDAARKDCAVAFDKTAGVWRLLQGDPDRYIYDAVRHGVELALPPDIATGVTDVRRRTGWNKAAPPEYALPTEIWREVVERRRRYAEIRTKLASGDVHEVNDLITVNLDIRQFAQDVIQYAEGPELIRAFFKAIKKVSVLDPTCGSGAFLFAALNILKPLYEACLQRMQMFVDELEAGGPHHPKKFDDFRQTLTESLHHPKQDYFILKSIIVNNLYGVDIMEEAVEICKLRLFLKLVAQVEPGEPIEPLPDIDFNIRAGNTLVGYARLEDISKGQANVFLEEQIAAIEDKVKSLDAALAQFRLQQTKLNGTVTVDDKAALRERFSDLDRELNDLLSAEYGVKRNGIKDWQKSHKPFHWFSDFHQIMNGGGFDAIIGNPPYVEYQKVKSEYTLQSPYADFLGNLYAACCFRSAQLLSVGGYSSLVVPVSLPSTDRMASLRELLLKNRTVYQVSFSTRPQKLFEGAEQRLTIYVQAPAGSPKLYSGAYLKWGAEERGTLFSRIGFTATHAIGSRRGAWPKVGTSLEAGILERCYAIHTTVGTLSAGTGALLYYKNTGLRYFNTTTLRPPKCWINGKPTSSSRETSIAVAKEWRSAVHCVLLSSTFFLVYQAVSNCRDLNPSDIVTFGLPKTLVSDKRLAELSEKIEADCIAKGKILTMNNKLTGKVELESLSPARSKSIIDEIDAVLASHYGFSDEELDFIINYDIKSLLSKTGGVVSSAAESKGVGEVKGGFANGGLLFGATACPNHASPRVSC
ncbi:MAG TPA: SNF2-related protein [Bryobacteraceae bacterium]|nr:SNF2-related protein [Bryobacteraceae bacterium]